MGDGKREVVCVRVCAWLEERANYEVAARVIDSREDRLLIARPNYCNGTPERRGKLASPAMKWRCLRAGDAADGSCESARNAPRAVTRRANGLFSLGPRIRIGLCQDSHIHCAAHSLSSPATAFAASARAIVRGHLPPLHPRQLHCLHATGCCSRPRSVSAQEPTTLCHARLSAKSSSLNPSHLRLRESSSNTAGQVRSAAPFFACIHPPASRLLTPSPTSAS